MDPADNTPRKPMDLERASVPQGEVHVIAERCKECGYCIEYCPEKVLVYAAEINSRGYHFPLVAEDKTTDCVLCKFCDLICPELAIYTTGSNEAGEGEQ